MRLMTAKIAAVIGFFWCCSLHAQESHCTPYSKSVFAPADLDRVIEIIFENDFFSATNDLMVEGGRSFVNPISQLLLGVRAIEEGAYDFALSYLELSMLLSWEHDLCSKPTLDFFVIAARKKALESGVLTGDAKRLYFQLTNGGFHRDLGLISFEYDKVKACALGVEVDETSGQIQFKNC